MIAANIVMVFNLFILEVLLSVDNAAVLALMVKDLPAPEQKKALRYGLIGAYLMRGLCLLFACYAMHAWGLKIAGGAYLMYLVYGHFSTKVQTIEEDKKAGDSAIYRFLYKAGMSRLTATIVLVELMDLAFSIDNIFASIAISNNIWMIVTGVFIGIAAMRFIAWWFVKLMEKHTSLERSAFIVIGLLALKLIATGIMAGINYTTILNGKTADLIFSMVLIIIFIVPLFKKRL